jgi:hypothetical protein
MTAESLMACGIDGATHFEVTSVNANLHEAYNTVRLQSSFQLMFRVERLNAGHERLRAARAGWHAGV